MPADASSAPLDRSLDYLLEPLLLGQRRAVALRKRRRRGRGAVVGLVGAAIVVGSAVAAITYLGQPAPPAVKKVFREENAREEPFQDLPAPIPLLNASAAQTVAVSGDATLYGAQAKGGYYCTILLRKGQVARREDLQCEWGVYPKAMRVHYKTLIWSGDFSKPLTFSGRLSRFGRTLSVRYANGLVDKATVGLRGYFAYEPAPALQPLAKHGPIRLVERDRHGRITDTQLLQPPIVIDESSKLSPQLVHGRTYIPGARYVGVQLNIWYPTYSAPRGPVKFIRLDNAGRFTWHAPTHQPKRFTIVLTVLDNHFRPLVDSNEVG
jgi:hypothetical protein